MRVIKSPCCGFKNISIVFGKKYQKFIITAKNLNRQVADKPKGVIFIAPSAINRGEHYLTQKISVTIALYALIANAA